MGGLKLPWINFIDPNQGLLLLLLHIKLMPQSMSSQIKKSPTPSFLMAFNYKIRPGIDMEGEDNDDDVFYAEIRRQILLLTAEEGTDNWDFPRTKNSSSTRSTKLCSGSDWSAALLPGSYFTCWSETQESATAPAWLMSLWRSGNSSNGTGVFIPHIVKSRRQQKPKERNNSRGRMYKPVAYKNE